MINFEFKSAIELVKVFPTQQICIDHLQQLRWNGNVVSPFDATSKVYKCAGNKYKCKNTGKYFTVLTASLFDNTKIELPTWFLAIYLITGHKKDISTLQLARDLNVTQKTAWFMNHRIRNCFGITDPIKDDGEKMDGEGAVVKVDATIVGGKVKNMSNQKRKEIKEKVRGVNDNKTAVLCTIERSNKIPMEVIMPTDSKKEMLSEMVDKGSVIITDGTAQYTTVGKEYALHGIVEHSKSVYVKDSVYYTNTLEGSFSLLDRVVMGIYHSISARHTQKYFDEFFFRYNSMDISENTPFKLMLSNTEHRLTYRSLIAK